MRFKVQRFRVQGWNYYDDLNQIFSILKLKINILEKMKI